MADSAPQPVVSQFPFIWCINSTSLTLDLVYLRRGDTETFERKAYEELAAWKEASQGSTALLIEGARRVGKSTIAEEFGRRNYASYMLVDFSKAVANDFVLACR